MDFYRLYKMIHANRIFWLFCVLVLVCNLIVHMTVIQRQRNEISRQDIQYQELRSHWKHSPDKQDASHVYEEGLTALETFRESLPGMSNLSDKARELRSFLHKNRITSGKILFAPDRKEGLSLWKYSSTLSVYGTYEDIKGLLSDIQGSPSLFCIEHLSLAKETKQGQVNMGLRIATYCR
jgi:Tfp pilus assembly protein PilO